MKNLPESSTKNSTPAPEILSAMANDQVFTKALFTRPDSLSALLPYGEFLKESSIWQNLDGSLGVVFAVSLLEHEPMSADAILASVDTLGSWLSLPPNCSLQVLYEQNLLSPRDPRFDAAASSFGNAHPVSALLFNDRLTMLREAARDQTELAPFSRRLLLAIRYFPKSCSNAGAKFMMTRGEQLLMAETKQFIRDLREFKAICDDFVSTSPLPLERLDAAGLLAVLRQFFNPQTYHERPLAPLNPGVPFSDQLIYSSLVLDHSGLTREGLKTRTISLKTSPQVAYPGGMAYFTRLSFPFRLALNFSFPHPSKVKKFFDLKEFFLQNTPSARSRRQRDEVLAVQDRLARDDRCLNLTFNVVIDGHSDEELESRTREILNVFQNDLGCEAIVEDVIGLGLCLNTLPLMYSPKADYSTRRFIRILRSDAIKFLPVFDSFRGLNQPLQLYTSRERNLVNFSLNENETSNHTVVLADTGAWKSAFIIDCIQAAKRQSPEPLVFVVDKKTSYLMLSKYFDADLTVFDRGGDVPFSPFRGIFDDEKITFLTNLIAAGIKLTSPSFAVESEHLTALTKALRFAHDKKLERAGLAYLDGELRSEQSTPTDVYVAMDDIVAELAALPGVAGFERFEPTVEALIPKLSPFYGDGIYARFFRGSTGMREKQNSKSKLFFIYDLDALDSDPTLQALMTMAVVEEIRQTIKRPEHQGRGGFIVLEELGMLGRHNPYASQFIKDAAETFRKLGYWLIALTPRPQNYFETEAGQAMWGAADNFIFMQMSEDNVRYLAEHSSLLDEAGLGIVRSLRTLRGRHADVFYTNKAKTRQGSFRFIQTPLGRWLAPTNPSDASAAAKALRRHVDDKWRALAELAENGG